MKKHSKIGLALTLGSTISLSAPCSPALYAAEPTTANVQVLPAPSGLALDVVLNAKGEIRGAAVNANGSPAANSKVTLNQGTGKEGLQTTTDEAGRFVLPGVRQGVYSVTVVADQSRAEKIVRVWRQETAPPAATPVAVVKLQGAQTDEVVRGQPPGGNPPPPLPPPPLPPEGDPGAGGAGRILLGTAVVGSSVLSIIAISGGFEGNKIVQNPVPASP